MRTTKAPLHAAIAVAFTALLPGTANTAAPARTGPVPGATTPMPPAEIATVTEAPADGLSPSSTEQGRTTLEESFDWARRADWIRERRRDAFRDTEFKVHVRSMYLDRDKFDGSESEAWALGGWAGFRTGYFRDHFAFGVTGYTSQPLYAPDDKDGTLLLKPGQEGYTVLGEAFLDLRITDDLNLYVGRKEYDTPYINRNDARMTPNTFEAVVLQGRAKLGENESIKYGAGYFDKIKERNSDEFVPMSEDAGATVDRGVFTGGATYQRGGFSIGAIDYYCQDVINIAYGEVKTDFPIGATLRPRVALQFSDQRATGSAALGDEDLSAQQVGVKAELPCGGALFSVAYTNAFGDAMQSPWSGYPGYTSVQVQDFNRADEQAVLLRAGYDWTCIKGLGAYALWVHGTNPDGDDQFQQDEVNLNLQWGPKEGMFKGLLVRFRYAFVTQDGTEDDTLQDLRAICSYNITW